MAYRIPSLTDFKYKNSNYETVDAPSLINSIYEYFNGNYLFKGWITNRRVKDIAYPGGQFDPQRIADGKDEMAFYVDESIRLWDDCSENSEQDASSIRDLCIEGMETQLSMTNFWDVEGNAAIGGKPEYSPGIKQQAEVISSLNSPEAGYFFRFPLGTQLSVTSNDNFKNIVQFDGSSGSWTKSFSMDMWAKVSNDSMMIFQNSGSTPTSIRSIIQDENGIQLILANRSQLIGNFNETGHVHEKEYQTKGYDMYMMIGSGRFIGSNFNPTPNAQASNECMRTGQLSANEEQPGTLLERWSNIIYGWTYFAFSYNADTTELIGYVKGTNADFLWDDTIDHSSSQIIAGSDKAIQAVVRNFGYLIGSMGMGLNEEQGSTQGYTFGYTPEISVKSFRVYDRALSYDEMRGLWEEEQADFRPTRILTQFKGLYVASGEDGQLQSTSIYRDADNLDPYMYTKVATSSLVGGKVVWTAVDNSHPENHTGDWAGMIRFPRDLSLYTDPGKQGQNKFLQNIPRDLFIGWTGSESLDPSFGNQPEDIAKISAEPLYDFSSYPDELVEENEGYVVSANIGYGRQRSLNPVVLARVAYVNTADDISVYGNYSAGNELVAIANGPEIGFPESWNGLGNLQQYWTTEKWDGERLDEPSKFADFGSNITTWSKLSSFFYTSNGQARGINDPLLLYPVYKMIGSGENYKLMKSWSHKTGTGAWSSNKTAQIVVYLSDYVMYSDQGRGFDGMVIHAQHATKTRKGNDKGVKLSAKISVYINTMTEGEPVAEISTYNNGSIWYDHDPGNAKWVYTDFDLDFTNTTGITSLVCYLSGYLWQSGGSDHNESGWEMGIRFPGNKDMVYYFQ